MKRAASGIPSLVLAVCVSGLLGACFGGSVPEPAPDDEFVRFGERVSRFYAYLEEVPLDALLTYENKELHGFFASEPAFADYYSALANQVRDQGFRDGRVERVEVLDLRLESEDLARVDLRVAGRHQRVLRFWEIDIERTDTWRKVGGVWLLAPDKL